MKHCTTCQFIFADTALNCPHDNTLLRFVRELEPNMIIRGKYHILDWIGAGGMAAVYRAKHRLLNEMRAIKVVLPKYANDDEFLKRFRHEAAIARRLRHENAVWVEDLDEIEDGRPFIAMEFLEGTDLRSVIQKEGPLPVPRAMNLAQQVASALSAAHKLGITHRDIKPDNIFLTHGADGREIAKVLDFGIAKVKEGAMDGGFTATKTGILLGTPQYISPEQAIGKVGDKLDGRADLYSLGIVIYEMLTGRIPFESDTPMGMLLQHVNTIPQPPDQMCPQLGIPRAVSQVLMKSLEKDREKRFQTADEMIQALRDPEKWAAANGVAATPPPPPPPARASLQATVVVSPHALQAVTEPLQKPADSGVQQGTTQPLPYRQASMGAAVQPQPAPPQPPPRRVEYAQTTPQQQQGARAASTSRQPPPKKNTGLVAGVVVAILALALVGLYFAFGNRENSDAEIQNRVVDAFHHSKNAALVNDQIKVQVENGTVTLSGEVPADDDKQSAANVAMWVSGVKRVENDLSVKATVSVVPTPLVVATPLAVATQTPQEHANVERITADTHHTSSTHRTPQPRLTPHNSDDAAEVKAFIDLGNEELNSDNPNYNKAISDFRQALEIAPNNTAAKAGLNRALRAQRADAEINGRR